MADWQTALAGLRLDSLRQESADRIRFRFTSDTADRVLVASLRPSDPWLAESSRRWEGPQWSPHPAIAAAAQALVGRRVERIVKVPADRSVRFEMGSGRGFALELTRSPNFILLADGGVVEEVLRGVNSGDNRLTPGHPWSPRAVPLGKLDPFSMTAREIDAATGEPLTTRFIGLGAVAPDLLARAHRAGVGSIGTQVRARLDSILDGSSEVLIETPGDESSPLTWRLLPWRPESETPGSEWVTHRSAAVTAGFYFEAHDAAVRVRDRIAALLAMLRREITRARNAGLKVRAELTSFDEPEKLGRMGEALLAGLRAARRVGDAVLVMNPYDPEGGEIEIPAPADRALTKVADDLFKRQRRSRRGLSAAAARADALERRMSSLEELLDAHAGATGESDAESLEASMRGLGLPVGLTGPTRAARAAARVSAPQLAGVRMITSSDGWTILVGRTGPSNDKLTFKIAAPDDFWLHAANVPGAHVVIRNPERQPSAPKTTLAEAAALALWFSDGRADGVSDVHWTKRKNVKRAKGGSSGKVVLKRFETIRVRARSPRDES